MRSLLLMVILALLVPRALHGQGVKVTDLVGEWILAFQWYGETDYYRMMLDAQGDQITVTFVGQKLDGTIRDGRIELQRSSDSGSGASMTGRVDRNEMSGEFTLRDRQGKWKATRAPVRPPNAPRLHTFEPKEFPRFFSGAIEPALRIYPGDTVQTWSVDAGGMDPKGVRRSQGGNPLTGPFYVEGAMPGDVLAVKFTRIRPNRDTAFSGDSLSTNAITSGYVQTRKPVPFYNSGWILDRDKGIAGLAQPTDALKDYSVPLKPILGSVGVAPMGNMVFRSTYLGSFGGNLDYNRLREGVTLYLPVYQPGALLFMGDGHAVQGDGELTGNALETSMDIEFTVDVIRGKSLSMPRAEDDESLMAMGIAGSLTEALQVATTQMAGWLADQYKLNSAEVASVLGTAMQYDIAEVVDPNLNVVARVSKKALAQIRKPGI